MIDVLILSNICAPIMQIRGRVYDTTSCTKGARSADINWKHVTNNVNPLGRHPFNILTTDIIGDTNNE